MKKLHILSYAALAAVALGFSACEEELSGPQINVSQPTAPVLSLSTSGTTFVLDKDKANNNFQTISWTDLVFGDVSMPIEYSLQFDKTGADFNDATNLYVGKEKSKAYKVVEFNELLIAAGLPHSVEHTVSLRVLGTVKGVSGNASITPVASNIITFKVTPYTTIPPAKYTNMGLVGDFCRTGWNGPDLQFAHPSEIDTRKWTLMAYLKASGAGKFRVDSKWDVNWGKSDKEGVASPGGFGNDFKVSEDGYYKIDFDDDKLTYSFVKQAAKPTYNSVGIVGPFTDWGGKADIAMTVDAHDPYYYVATGVSLPAGPMKFRANGSWDKNWGYTNAGKSNIAISSDNDGNIVVSAAGTFDITFNSYTGIYTITKK